MQAEEIHHPVSIGLSEAEGRMALSRHNGSRRQREQAHAAACSLAQPSMSSALLTGLQQSLALPGGRLKPLYVQAGLWDLGALLDGIPESVVIGVRCVPPYACPRRSKGLPGCSRGRRNCDHLRIGRARRQHCPGRRQPRADRCDHRGCGRGHPGHVVRHDDAGSVRDEARLHGADHGRWILDRVPALEVGT